MKRYAFLMVAGAMTLAGSAQAALLVNLDLGNDYAVYSGRAVVGTDGDFWNSNNNGKLLQADKTETAIAFTASWRGAWDNGSAKVADSLMRDYIFSLPEDGSRTVVFTGLAPAKTYDIYAYSSGTTGRAANFSVSTKPTDVHSLVQDTALSTFVEGSNYVRIQSFSPAADGTVTLQCKATIAELDLNGFQLIEVVPEPSSLGLLSLGALALLRRRRV